MKAGKNNMYKCNRHLIHETVQNQVDYQYIKAVFACKKMVLYLSDYV